MNLHLVSNAKVTREVTYLLFAMLSALCASSWTAGCRTAPITDNEQFRVLFDGYQLNVVDAVPQKVPLEDLQTFSFRNSYPLEEKLLPGRAYVFRKTNTTSEETMGMKKLPARLAQIGARVTKAPHSSRDFIYLYVGGPLFLIEFEKDGHRGMIHNRVNGSEKTGENWEELVVAYR